MMKGFVALAVAAAVVPASAMAAMPAGDIIDQLFEKAIEAFGNKGYSPTGWQQKSALGQNSEQSFTFRLQAGQTYQIVASCDTDCSNVDAVLIDPSGKIVSSDVEADDFPIVSTTPASSGIYTLRVSMITCKTSACAIGVKSFQKS
jgi:hypothetical protein